MPVCSVNRLLCERVSMPGPHRCTKRQAGDYRLPHVRILLSWSSVDQLGDSYSSAEHRAKLMWALPSEEKMAICAGFRQTLLCFDPPDKWQARIWLPGSRGHGLLWSRSVLRAFSRSSTRRRDRSAHLRRAYTAASACRRHLRPRVRGMRSGHSGCSFCARRPASEERISVSRSGSNRRFTKWSVTRRSSLSMRRDRPRQAVFPARAQLEHV